MYVRLAFAVAAHLTTEILIVDEVLAVGDTEFQKKCLGKMGEVASHGRTVLFVSHNLAAVRSLCNSAVLLSKGRIRFAGSADEAISEYLNTFAPMAAPPGGYIYRDDRLGIALAPIELRDGAGRVVPALQTGKPGELRMSIITSKEWNSVTGYFGFNSVADNYRICAMYSSLTNDEFSLRPPGTDLVCYIPKVSLMPGRYRVTLSADLRNQPLFYLPDSAEIEVVPGDFFGTGKLPDTNWSGPFIIEQRWSSEEKHISSEVPGQPRAMILTTEM
jgi:lipopolysaccharide transport system ATP-binding protein